MIKKKYSCLVVDDEPLAIDLIVSHIEKVPELQLKDSTHDAVVALNLIRNNHYDIIFLDIQMPEITGDIIFLDIQMPEITGMEILEIQPQLSNVVLTTAYRNYAVDSYNFEVLDYLVKPISFERFMKSVNRFLKKKEENNNPTHFFVNENRKQVRVDLEDILYLSSQRDYLHIILPNKKVVVRKKITEMMDMLPSKNFVRIHQSFVINKEKVTAVYKSGVEVNNQYLPVSRAYSKVIRELTFY